MTTGNPLTARVAAKMDTGKLMAMNFKGNDRMFDQTVTWPDGRSTKRTRWRKVTR